MGFAELTQTKGWKNFMAKLYGLGAAVVIIGALFKIMHWPGAGPMLVVGLITESIIFIFSAFEPLHEEDDWSLVYPQLVGLSEDDEIPTPKPTQPTQVQTVVASSGSALAKFDELIDSAEITPDLFQKLGKGLQNLSDSTSKLSDLSDASVATNEYTKSVKSASASLNNISENANMIKKSGDDLASSYQSVIDSMSIDFSSVAKSNTKYANELDTINKNLSALNAVYELQLQSTNESLQKSQEFYAGLDNMMGDMKDASSESEKYRNGVKKLGKKLEALNTVYGNMLTAMNVKNV